ncbi:MAG: hypothetical protein NT028_12750, partial [candidate division Zixibacteria bacterium]|nr:hypothetical protein [candidate division Zixibacteria bacterium]
PLRFSFQPRRRGDSLRAQDLEYRLRQEVTSSGHCKQTPHRKNITVFVEDSSSNSKEHPAARRAGSSRTSL